MINSTFILISIKELKEGKAMFWSGVWNWITTIWAI